MKLKGLQARYVPLLATAVVFAGLYGVGLACFDNFSSLRVFVNLFGDNAFVGVAAIGATFVILSGGIDLSVGAVVAFTSIFVATAVSRGMPPPAAIALALLFGVVFGAGMGCLIHFYELPPFLVTLAGMFFARGMGFVIYPQSLGIKHEFFGTTVGQDLALQLTPHVELPFTAACFLLLFVVALFLAHWTAFGRNVYALGGNELAAKLMGLPVGRTKVLVYTLAGFFSALAGVVFTFYMQSGNPASCVGLELDAIASVVIGGTLLTGGTGYVAGTLLGVLVLGLIQTLITFKGDLNSWWTKIAVGVLVLLFILMQNFVSSFSRRSAGK
jgi:simple sugar transport system permease protein